MSLLCVYPSLIHNHLRKSRFKIRRGPPNSHLSAACLAILPKMPAATQGYVSPSSYGSANMFAQPGRNLAKSNDFLKDFGHGATNIRTIEPQLTTKNTARSLQVGSLDTDEPSFFDFEPPTRMESPYRNQFSTPGASGLPWGADLSFQPLSPPNSASFSPKDPWAYEFQYQNPSNIITNIDPANTRAHYGQVTPPNDENDGGDLFGYQLREQQRHQIQPPLSDSSSKKRKRNGSQAQEQASQPAKRNRKYASRGSQSLEGREKPEDVKRSKFLERNRVAASKCRQKKKEWTQNLENRARELQKNNNMLRMDLESLRQETLFLKGEMLKHTSCDCEQIQAFVKSQKDNFLDAPGEDVVFKREQSPIESMPRSSASPRHSSHREIESTSPAAEPANTSIVDDENALEALLSSSIHHDTSEEGIASRVER